MTNPNGAAINIQTGKSVISLAKDKVNTLCDGDNTTLRPAKTKKARSSVRGNCYKRFRH